MRQAGASDQEAHEAAVAAVQTVLPLPWKEASVEAVNAIAYATRNHLSGSGGVRSTHINGDVARRDRECSAPRTRANHHTHGRQRRYNAPPASGNCRALEVRSQIRQDGCCTKTASHFFTCHNSGLHDPGQCKVSGGLCKMDGQDRHVMQSHPRNEPSRAGVTTERISCVA